MKSIKPDGSNNFCRVFEMPKIFPGEFCFGGGHEVVFKMVDWFQPIPAKDIWCNKIKPWKKYRSLLYNFLKEKPYIRHGYKYLVITNFDESVIFDFDNE